MTTINLRRRPGYTSAQADEASTTRPGFIRRYAVAIALVAGLIGVGVYGHMLEPQDRWLYKYQGEPESQAAQQTEQTAGPFPAAKAEAIRRLRDEAITIIGWVAGNAYGREAWPLVEPYVGRGGSWYDGIMQIKSSPDANDETEAILNVALYREWFEKGQAVPFNEDEATSRLKRGLQIVQELQELIKQIEK